MSGSVHSNMDTLQRAYPLSSVSVHDCSTTLRAFYVGTQRSDKVCMQDRTIMRLAFQEGTVAVWVVEINTGFLALFSLPWLTAVNGVRPSFQNSSLNSRAAFVLPTRPNAVPLNAIPSNAPQSGPPGVPGKGIISLINYRKGFLLPMELRPEADSSQLCLSISGPGDMMGEPLILAHCLLVKYHYQLNNVMLLSYIRHYS
ncbi:hypothetical protein XENOCAPTIV_002049 [Xenoophorus captivus]|uniref:Uncharacterized protein n=1 Tax=Xenoophorus captivus TaxID=1517983 RepID=A0ABV0QUQ0_9TELE